MASGKALLASANTNLQGFIGLPALRRVPARYQCPSAASRHLGRVLVKINLRISKFHLPRTRQICVPVGLAIMDLDDCKYPNCIIHFLTASNLRLRKPRNIRLAVFPCAQLHCYLVLYSLLTRC
jgi:hypothetical protein